VIFSIRISSIKCRGYYPFQCAGIAVAFQGP